MTFLCNLALLAFEISISRRATKSDFDKFFLDYESATWLVA